MLIGNHALAPFKKRMFFVEGEYFFLTGCPLMGDPNEFSNGFFDHIDLFGMCCNLCDNNDAL